MELHRDSRYHLRSGSYFGTVPKELVRFVQRRTNLPDIDESRIVKYVYSLRRAFRQSEMQYLEETLGRTDLHLRIVEHDSFGYRISLPPENLELKLIDKLPKFDHRREEF